MKQAVSPELEKYRVTNGPMASKPEYGFNGVFVVQRDHRTRFVCIASDGGGWDHVSVEVKMRGSLQRLPTWEEMCWIRKLFFEDEEVVVQYHPPKSQYVNVHPFVLHLWRNQSGAIPLPPMRYV